MSAVDLILAVKPETCLNSMDSAIADPIEIGYEPAELELSVPARFAKVMRSLPQGHLAYVDSSETLTYAALDQKSNQLAYALAEKVGGNGILGKQKSVALLLPHRAESLVGILGVLKAGHFYVPLAAEQEASNHVQIIADCPPEAFVTTRALLPNALALLTSLPQVPILLIDELPDGQTEDMQVVEISSQAMAMVLYTSGSTGKPRGVMRTQRQLLSSAYLSAHELLGIIPTSRVAHLLSFAFGGSTMILYGALLNGATLCAISSRGLTADRLYAWLQQQQITVLLSIPALLRELTEVAANYPLLASMKTVYIGGETITPQDIERIQKLVPTDCRLVCILNSTEVGNYAFFVMPRGIPWTGTRVPAGYANSHVQLMLIDDMSRPVGPNVEGQICVRSRYLSPGYWNQPALNAIKFLPDPDGGDQPVFLTGDLGRMAPDGLLEHLGRIDFMVKIRGFRVEPETIEQALMAHPALHACVVVARPNHRGESRLIAYLVTRIMPSPSVHELRALLAQSLPDYMIPARFVYMENLPRNVNGKIDRAVLPAPDVTRPDLNTPFVKPDNELAQQLADRWAELLELDEVGVNDNFFELGGDSITAMRIVLHVQEQYSYPVSMDFFRNPTVAQLAQLIAGEVTMDEHKPHRPAPTKPSLPLPPQHFRSYMIKYMLATGPLWRGYALPYGMGVRMQRQWIKLLPMRQILQKRSAILQDWFTLLGQDDPNGQRQELSILGNSWRTWRHHCIQQPETFAQWVTIRGSDILEDVLATERPVILVGTHTTINSMASRIMLQKSSTRPIWTLGYSPTGNVDVIAKVIKARKILMQQGLVYVIADGAQGTKGIEASLGGRMWLFRSGAAELAVDTNAILLPVFNTLALTGHITVEFLAPLTSTVQTKQGQIEDLTRQYVALLETRWSSLISNMTWSKLQQIMAYSTKDIK